jgi:hypothetical protein
VKPLPSDIVMLSIDDLAGSSGFSAAGVGAVHDSRLSYRSGRHPNGVVVRYWTC